MTTSSRIGYFINILLRRSASNIFINSHDFYILRDESRRSVRAPRVTVLETRLGLKIAVRHNIYDFRILKEQFLDQQYFPSGFYQKNFKPITVLDIGGYIGDFAFYCASVFGSTVHCYEPTPENFKIIEWTYGLNPSLMNKVMIFNEAVSSSEGFIKLNVQVIDGEVHASSNRDYLNDSSSIEIPCLGLEHAIDRITKERLDLLKIDCEGEEFNILEGCGTRVLSDRVRYLVFECHPFVENFVDRRDALIKRLEASFWVRREKSNLYFLRNKSI